MPRSSRVVSHRPQRRRALVVVSIVTSVVVALGLAVSFGGWTAIARLAGGCAGPPVTLTVVAAPSVAPTLAGLAQQWSDSKPHLDGRCVRATVAAKESASVAASLGSSWNPQADGPRPDVWVPESSLWLRVAATQPDAAATLPLEPTSLGASAVVLALRSPLADALGWPGRSLTWPQVIGAFVDPTAWTAAHHPEWAALRVGVTDPATSTAGLAFVLAVLDPTGSGTVSEQQLAAGLGLTRAIGSLAPDTGTFLAAQTSTAGPDANIAAFPALESDVARYDRDHPDALVPVYPDGPPFLADFPYSVLSASGPKPDPRAMGTTWGGSSQAAANQFGQFLLTPAAQTALAAIGLRGPDGTATPGALLSRQPGFHPQVATNRALPDAQALSRIVAEWANLQRRVDLLALLDTSGSMATSLPGTPLTRLALLQQTAGTGFGFLPNTMHIGLWEFSQRDGDPSEYRELVPYGPIIGTTNGMPRSQALAQAVPRLRADGATPLYDSAYAAFHYMQKQWTSGSTNSVLLITDGYNEVPGGLSLQELVKRLKAEQRPDQPVQVVCIGIGKQADAAALNQISSATGGRTFIANDAATAIQTLILAFTGRLQ